MSFMKRWREWMSSSGKGQNEDERHQPLLVDEGGHPGGGAAQTQEEERSGAVVLGVPTQEQQNPAGPERPTRPERSPSTMTHWDDPDSIRFVYMGVWVTFCVINFLIGRLFTQIDMPYDALHTLDPYALYDSLTRLMLFSVVLGWFVRISQPQRFFWLFHGKRWYFFVLFFAVNPLYSAISSLEPLHHSTEDYHNWSPTMTAVMISGGIIVLAVVVWHSVLAFRRKTWSGFFVYFLARLAVIGYYFASSLFLSTSRHNDLHLHHYFTAWCGALFAEFNHPISAAFLAVMTAIFTQGVSAYTFAPLFNDNTCFTTKSVTNARCTFSSTENFTLSICPGALGAIPESKCYTTRLSDNYNSFIGGSNLTDPFLWRDVLPFEMFMDHP